MGCGHGGVSKSAPSGNVGLSSGQNCDHASVGLIFSESGVFFSCQDIGICLVLRSVSSEWEEDYSDIA